MYREKFITLVIKRLKRVANKIHNTDCFDKQLFFLLLDNIHNDNILNIVKQLYINIQQSYSICLLLSHKPYDIEYKHIICLYDVLYEFILNINDSSISDLESFLFLIKHDLKNVNNFYSTVPSPNSVITSK